LRSIEIPEESGGRQGVRQGILRNPWERRMATMDSSMVRIVCAVLAALFLGLIVMRRKKSVDE